MNFHISENRDFQPVFIKNFKSQIINDFTPIVIFLPTIALINVLITRLIHAVNNYTVKC
jgi:hypothetical protein